MSENTGSKMFFSFLSGAAIGAGLALLFAPQAGKETRKQIKDFSEKLGGEVKEGYIREKIQDLGRSIAPWDRRMAMESRNAVYGSSHRAGKSK
jgi:gas vesicle protein